MRMSQPGPVGDTVLPEVRYHPSIRAPDRTTQTQNSGPGTRPKPKTRTRTRTKKVQENQNPEQTASQTRPPPEPVLPEVRYHPSIRASAGGGSVRTRTQNSGPDPRPQPKTNTRTRTRTVQENQNPGRPQAEPASSGPDPATRPGPRPKQDPLDPLDPEAHLDPGSHLDPEAHLDPGAHLDPEAHLDPGAPLDRSVVDQVEVLTRGQRTNPLWFSWRKNRITASVAHRIAHSRFANGQSKAPPTSYLQAITGEAPRVQTRAMTWGIEMEAQAVRRYQQLKSEALGRPVRVLDCGLMVDRFRPWLAASPDGVVTVAMETVAVGTAGRWLLEVKCPYKHRKNRLEDACQQDKNFCLQLEPGQTPAYSLKRSHSYYTQIQVQLGVAGLDRADLLVYTRVDAAIVPVTFDPQLWEETVAKLERFYRGAVLPHLRGKQPGAPELAPEL